MTAEPSRDWDGKTYDRIAAPQTAWGRAVLDRLALRGDEVVMDAGCGSGRVTRMLLERLPRGRVYAVDRSPSMLAEARRSLTEFGDRVVPVEADLTRVALPEPVSLIFSTATFHWITDHEALFAHLHGLLRPGGRLVAQCGGGSNIAYVLELVDRIAARPAFNVDARAARAVWHYASAEETAERLARAGFSNVETWAQPEPVTFATAEAYGEFLQNVILHPYLERLPASAHRPFVDAVVAEAGRNPRGYLIDYVRLNMTATRP